MSVDKNLQDELARKHRELAFTEAKDSHVLVDVRSSKGLMPMIRRADTIKERELEPLWPGVLWRGYPTLIAGDGGLGKSTASIDIAARLTRGDFWPASDVKAKPGNVLIINAEDGAADVVVPRLRVADADRSRVTFFDGFQTADGKEYGLNLTSHLSELDQLIGSQEIDLVIIDPLSAFEGRTDSHKNSEVRSMLAGLQRTAERRRCSLMLVTHLNKSTNQPGLSRINGSIAYGAAVRAAYLVVRDSTNDERRIMAPVKNNLAADSVGFGFRIEDRDGISRVAWDDDVVTERIDDILGVTQKSKSECCREFLIARLENGPVEATELRAAGAEAGFGRDLIFKTLRQPRFIKSGGGNQHSKAVYRLSPGPIDIDDPFDEATERE